MAGYIHPDVFDSGLSYAKTNADKIYICSTQPANYTEATSTYALGNKDFGAGNVFPGAIADTTPTGSRQITTAAVTDGSVTADGTAGFWAIVKSSATAALLAAYSLSATQVVTNNNTFTLAAFNLKFTAPA